MVHNLIIPLSVAAISLSLAITEVAPSESGTTKLSNASERS